MAAVHSFTGPLGGWLGGSVSLSLWVVILLATTWAITCLALARKLGARWLHAELEGVQAAAAILHNELVQTKSELANSERRREELFSQIDGIVQECNDWRRLYHTEASMHGTAQAMLMDERNYFLGQFKRLGVIPRTNKTIDQVVAMHAAEHADPSREALEQMNQALKNSNGTESGLESDERASG